MFEPEYQNIDCPKCLHRRVYFDREIGYYCMSCGHEFSTKEMVMLFEKTLLTSQTMHSPGKGEQRPAIEIKELPPRKAKLDHLSQDTTERNKPEQEVLGS